MRRYAGRNPAATDAGPMHAGDDGHYTRKMAALSREVGAELRSRITQGGATHRETLREAIGRHGGARSVVEQMGFTPGTKEYRSTLRSVERHATTAGEQRGLKGLSDKYKGLYERVLGPEGLREVTSREKGKGKLPDRGTITIEVSGLIIVSEDEDERGGDSGRAPAREFYEPEDFDALLADPLQFWTDHTYGGFAQRLDELVIWYDSGEDDDE